MVTARPEYEPAWAPPGRLTRLALGRLGQRQSAALAGAVAGPRTLPREVLDEIARRADGVPLFVEELTRAIAEAGASSQMPNAAGPAPPAGVVPATLQDSLMARLDRLPPPARSVAQVGAVIGREFPVRLLSAVAGQDAASVGRALDELARADLVVRVDRGGEALGAFRHALVRDAAYESLLRSERQRRHAQVAAAMESLYADRLTEVYDRLGDHCAVAELWPKAADYFARAGARAFETAAFEEAAALFERALQACEPLAGDPATDRQRLRLLFRLHDALLPLGRYRPMREVLERAERLASPAGDRLALARVYSYQGHFAWIARADNDAAAGYALRSLDLARELGNRQLQIANRFYLGQIEYSRGRLRESVEAFRPNLEAIGTSAGVPRFERFFGISSMGWAVFPLADLGRFDEAASLAAEALAAAEASGDPLLLIPTWFGQAHLHWSRGDFEAAIAVCERFAAEPGTKGLLQWYVPLTTLLAASLAHTGALARALDLFEEVASLHERVGLVAHESFTYATQADALRLAGRVDDAVRAAQKALRLARERSEEGFAALARWALALALMESQPRDVDAARAQLALALQTSRRIGHRVLEAKCLRALEGGVASAPSSPPRHR